MDAGSPTTLDLKGLKCPLPVLRSRKAIRSLAKGSLLSVETTDPLAVIDMAHMCQEDGHQLVESEKTPGGHRFLIRTAG